VSTRLSRRCGGQEVVRCRPSRSRRRIGARPRQPSRPRHSAPPRCRRACAPQSSPEIRALPSVFDGPSFLRVSSKECMLKSFRETATHMAHANDVGQNYPDIQKNRSSQCCGSETVGMALALERGTPVHHLGPAPDSTETGRCDCDTRLFGGIARWVGLAPWGRR